MSYWIDLFTVPTVPQAVLILGLVVALGLFLGSIRIFGVVLGTAGVLFAGILVGHFQIAIDEKILDFTRDFGLILFVYALGMQVGPSFFSSFQKNGIRYNLLALWMVGASVGMTALIGWAAKIPATAMVGLMAGATTNTPSLAAAQQMLRDIPGLDPVQYGFTGLSYAAAYPFGVMGAILVIQLIRWIFRITPEAEAKRYAAQHEHQPQPLVMDIRVENPNLDGIVIGKIPGLGESGVVVSRVFRGGKMEMAFSDTVIHSGDILRAVSTPAKLESFRLIVGSECKIDLRGVETPIVVKRVIMTKSHVVGKTISELDIRNRYEVIVTRLRRADIEFSVTPDIPLHLGDTLVVVGEEEAIQSFAKDMGDSPKQLDVPHLIPVFLGIMLGVIAGSIPIALPGVPLPVKLGMACGPLLVSMTLSHIRRIGPFVWFMPHSANYLMREMGISLFLACVGLRAGGKFVSTLLHGDGLVWMAWGTLITFVPLMTTGLWLRLKEKDNYLSLCGLLSGGTTDPAALAFVNQMAASNAQMVSYATIYPFSMILRVLAAQLFVLFTMS